jgi:hypothetical protein
MGAEIRMHSKLELHWKERQHFQSISTANVIDTGINTTEKIVARAMIEGRHSMADFELK